MPLMCTSDIDMSREYVGPFLLTPKLDGMRCQVYAQQRQCAKTGLMEHVMARSGKRIPNHAIRLALRSAEGMDGEILGQDAYDKLSYKQAISAAMRHEGESPNWCFHVFNFFGDGSPAYCAKPFAERWADCQKLYASLAPVIRSKIKLVHPVLVHSIELAQEIVADWHDQYGLEGGMLTVAEAPYFDGRCSNKQSWGLKLKPLADVDAEIIGMHEATYSAGKTIPAELVGKGKGQMGSLICRAPGFKETFKVGTGFLREERIDAWANQANWLGKICKVRYLPAGTDVRPRQPRFAGLRPEEDLLC